MSSEEVYIILLVEDEATDALLFEMALRKHKRRFRICQACDGVSGREWLMGSALYTDRAIYPSPDVVLLDLSLPDIHGFELLSWIRGQQCLDRLPVGILTGSVNEADLDRSAELGADFYLRKDTDLDRVAEALLRLLDSGSVELEFDSAPSTAKQNRLPRLVVL